MINGNITHHGNHANISNPIINVSGSSGEVPVIFVEVALHLNFAEQILVKICQCKISQKSVQ